MQPVRYRTGQILSIEGVLMRRTGVRMEGEAVKRLTAEQVDEFALAPDVALAVGKSPDALRVIASRG